MDRRKKAYTLLLCIFCTGFLLGLVIGVPCGRRSGRKAALAATSAQMRGLPDDNGSHMKDAEGGADEDSDEDMDGTGESAAMEIIYYGGRRIVYAKAFADKNDLHIAKAKAVGLHTVPETRDDLGSIKGLVNISGNRNYIVDELRYSVPFLSKGAARELDAIAAAFADSLKAKKLLDYKLIVSSVLRTEEDVNRLRRSGNPNASDNSAHCYGTTFDITYTRYYREDETEAFMQPYELTKVLAEVLEDRKSRGYCLVKYERKEHCFHITSCR